MKQEAYTADDSPPTEPEADRHGTIPTLAYCVPAGSAIRWGRTLALAVVLGLVSGLVWLDVGERLDHRVGNTVSWFICPLAFPLLVSLVMSLRARGPWTRSLAQAVVFVAVFYVAHWLPFAMAVAPFYL